MDWDNDLYEWGPSGKDLWEWDYPDLELYDYCKVPDFGLKV